MTGNNPAAAYRRSTHSCKHGRRRTTCSRSSSTCSPSCCGPPPPSRRAGSPSGSSRAPSWAGRRTATTAALYWQRYAGRGTGTAEPREPTGRRSPAPRHSCRSQGLLHALRRHRGRHHRRPSRRPAAVRVLACLPVGRRRDLPDDRPPVIVTTHGLT